MYGSFYNPNNKRVDAQNEDSQEYMQETFKALVDAIIPRTPELAEEYGKIQYYGALDFQTDEYLILSLNNYYSPLAKPTAEMLDMAAEQLVFALSITGDLNRLTMMGYYSEWYGYGSTRLKTPNQRKLEYFPLSWGQVEYPGPSLGYRALRA